MFKRFTKVLPPTDILIALFSFLMLLVSLIPLLLIGQYAHPCADDFTYGYYTHAYWSTTHSLSETLHWAFYQVHSTYDTWQGTFSSVFLMALSPAVWGEQYYFLTPVIMLSMIVLPHFYLLYRLLIKFLQIPKNIWITTSSIICFIIIQTMHTPVEGLYWFNGAVHYVFMHGCMLLLIGTLIPTKSSEKMPLYLIRYIISCFLAFVCGGSNYPTALTGIILTFGITLLSYLFKEQRIGNTIVFIIYCISFYTNITAYGNQIRQASFVKDSPIVAIGKSFLELYQHASTWISLQVILFMLLMIPIFRKLSQYTNYSFRFPVLISIISICVTACMMTPGLYSMGIVGAGRTFNIIKIWFLLLLFLNEAYWIGYLHSHFHKLSIFTKIDLRIYIIGILFLILIAFMVFPQRKLMDYSSYAAYVSLRANEAQAFHNEYLERLEILNSDDSLVTLPDFKTKPRLLYFDDIQPNPYDWRNNAVARWYGKERVTLE